MHVEICENFLSDESMHLMNKIYDSSIQALLKFVIHWSVLHMLTKLQLLMTHILLLVTHNAFSYNIFSRASARDPKILTFQLQHWLS